jgi:hypothetical protein
VSRSSPKSFWVTSERAGLRRQETLEATEPRRDPRLEPAISELGDRLQELLFHNGDLAAQMSAPLRRQSASQRSSYGRKLRIHVKLMTQTAIGVFKTEVILWPSNRGREAWVGWLTTASC